MKKKTLLFSIIALMSLSGCVKYNGLPPETAEHEHTFASVYSNDEKEHWYAATCEHTEQRRGVEEHKFGDYVILQEATLTTNGIKARTCSICDYKEETIINKINGESGGQPTGGDASWSITGINCNRDNIEMTVGDNPISVVATLVGEGSFPTSLAVSCQEIEKTSIVEGEEVKEMVKIAEVSSKVVESGAGFTISALMAGETKLVICSTGNANIKKEINIKINPKVESHNISLSESSIEMNKGSQKVLACTTTDNVIWTTSDSGVVALENLTNSGVFLIAKKKSATPVTITATICGGTAFEMSATCQVSVVSNEQTIFNYYYINNQKLTDLHLFMWDDDGHNADWPGVPLGEASYINKDLFEVYKITIDKDERDFKNMIISGYDSEGKFVQTSDISISSFLMQNAFTIPELPKDVTEGSRKASIKICTFNLETDIFDEKYVALSIDKSTLFAGNSLNVNTYTSEAEVNYEIVNGEEFVEITNTSKEGFTVTGIKAGEATIRASIGEIYKELKITVVEDEELTYYFVNNYLWTDLKVYFFSEKDGTNNAEWPGVSLGEKAYTDEKGKDVYEIKFMKLADAWEAFIISGIDGTKEGRCQTVDIKFANFGLDNAVKIDGWTDENPNKAKVKFVSYEPSDKPFLNVTGDTFVKTGTSTYLTVETNSENVSYSVTSGNDFVELSNESDNGVNVTGKLAGTATIQIKVGEGENETIKTISFEVKDNGMSYYFFLNVDCWEDVRAYLFKGDNYKEGWPGEKLEVVDQDNDNKDVYVVSFDKFEEDWEYVIFSGTIDGNVKNRIQTDKIPLSKLDGDLNCAYPTTWKDDKPDNKEKNYSRIQQFDFLKIGNNSKTLHVDDEWNLSFISNKEVSFEDFDTDVVEVTLMNGYLKIKALKEGTATISVYINDGFDRISRTCEITVSNDKPTTFVYTVTNLPDWFLNDNPKLFAWVWGDGFDSQWVECSTFEGNIIFSMPYETVNGCKILRYRPEFTGTPNFDHKEQDGLWNQSDNITISGFTGNYQ